MKLTLSTDMSSFSKIKISIRVVGIIIGIIGLFVFYWMNNTKLPEMEAETTKLLNESKNLATTENQLTTLYNSMQYYLDETDRLYKETEEILTEFPTFMYLEDKILYADNLLKTDLSGYRIEEFSYGQSNFVMNVAYGPNSSPLELYSVRLQGKYVDLTYKQIKDLLNYGRTAAQRFVTNSITMTYNADSGYITGDIAFTTYFIPGQSTPYEFPPEVIEGFQNSNRIDDLFGAMTTPKS